MQTEQAEYLNGQVFTGDNGVSYNILKLVQWAERYRTVEEIPLAELRHEFWTDNQRSDEIDGSEEFVERALATQDYPILVQRTDCGELWVMDGRHRLYKALFHDSKETIKGYIIPVNELPSEAIDQEGVVWVI